ncbi:MAG: hypothetical protein HF976_07700 [ANME-2 cluster archaeon]|nr:hypothetical protein [ANME-2 cluster archaeon]MBC2701282.1 hypothetical protein [ANME-2 cluster archaeon]MBC2708608.1 hypothetical protein [ANME-2 cluster archaeon]MBC2763191.1 hypothetical protein [ANME-2 cluster archaeon]
MDIHWKLMYRRINVLHVTRNANLLMSAATFQSVTPVLELMIGYNKEVKIL